MQPGTAAPEEHWTEFGRVRLPTGDELLLRRRGHRFEIRFNGWELMSDRAHWSETALGALGCEGIIGAGACVLIGGLGIGYTLRAALDALPITASVVVAELLPEVIAWNRGPLGDVAGRPLADPRVTIEPHDVARVLRHSAGRFDAVLLDIDNGPEAVTFAPNRQLYGADGLALIRRALRPRGRLAIWSAGRAAAFEVRLAAHGFDWQAIEVPARGCLNDPRHVIYLAAESTTHAGPRATPPPASASSRSASSTATSARRRRSTSPR